MGEDARQLRRIGAEEWPARFGMVVAAESAGGLVAAEMSFAGVPWRADVHDTLLAGLLGSRPPAMPAGARPARLAELAARVDDAFGRRRGHPGPPPPRDPPLPPPRSPGPPPRVSP